MRQPQKDQGEESAAGKRWRRRFVSTGPEQTMALAEMAGSVLEAGDVVTLNGDLGAGKTTFAQGLCLGAGMDRSLFVRSPSFTLMNEYRGRTAIRHADLYRIDTREQYLSIGLFDPAFNGITIIEWADKGLEGVAPPPALNVTLRELSETEREIILECAPDRVEALKQVITI